MEKAKRVPKHLAKCLNCESLSKRFQLEEGPYQGLCRLGLEFFSNSPENIYLHQTK